MENVSNLGNALTILGANLEKKANLTSKTELDTQSDFKTLITSYGNNTVEIKKAQGEATNLESLLTPSERALLFPLQKAVIINTKNSQEGLKSEVNTNSTSLASTKNLANNLQGSTANSLSAQSTSHDPSSFQNCSVRGNNAQQLSDCVLSDKASAATTNRSGIKSNLNSCRCQIVNAITCNNPLLNLTAQDIEALDNTPILLGETELNANYSVTSVLVKQMLDSLFSFEPLSINDALEMMKSISSVLSRQSDTIASFALTRSAYLNNYTVLPTFIPLYIVALNLGQYIARYNGKAFDYKKAKQKALEKMKKQEKEKKEQMMEFSAAFDFGIA